MPNIYICQAEDKTFLGEYVPGESEIDGVATFENEEGKAIWRHQVKKGKQKVYNMHISH